jgi:hypothetical protein
MHKDIFMHLCEISMQLCEIFKIYIQKQRHHNKV